MKWESLALITVSSNVQQETNQFGQGYGEKRKKIQSMLIITQKQGCKYKAQQPDAAHRNSLFSPQVFPALSSAALSN